MALRPEWLRVLERCNSRNELVIPCDRQLAQLGGCVVADLVDEGLIRWARRAPFDAVAIDIEDGTARAGSILCDVYQLTAAGSALSRRHGTPR